MNCRLYSTAASKKEYIGEKSRVLGDFPALPTYAYRFFQSHSRALCFQESRRQPQLYWENKSAFTFNFFAPMLRTALMKDDESKPDETNRNIQKSDW